MEKDFLKWSDLKEKLDAKSKNNLFFKEGEIWWCSIGVNIGTEIYGKGDLFLRPVLIIRKLSPFSFFGIPMTTKVKSGSWYFRLNDLKKNSCINLAQLRVFDSRRIVYKLEQIGRENLASVRKALKELMLL